MIKIADSPSSRPDRMLTRLKINSIDDSVPRVIAIRQPKGPDGPGFVALARLPRLPGKSFFFICFSKTNNISSFFCRSGCRIAQRAVLNQQNNL